MRKLIWGRLEVEFRLLCIKPEFLAWLYEIDEIFFQE